MENYRPIITILSDWNPSDFYTAAIKGRILKLCPSANIVEIANQINRFSTSQASFILGNTFRFYPDNTIHIICVSTVKHDKNEYVIVKAFNQYFVGTDNGILGFMFNDAAEKKLVIDTKKLQQLTDIEFEYNTFPELEIFATAASLLANGTLPEEFAEPFNDLKLIIPFRPTIEDSVITGRVIYIDSYSNAITNITKRLFEKERQGRKFEIIVKSMNNKISRINKTYTDSSPGELLGLFNSIDLLEIAQNHGKVCEFLNITTDTTLRIKFYDN